MKEPCTKPINLGTKADFSPTNYYICLHKQSTIMISSFPSDTSIMRYEDTDLSSLTKRPFRFECGIQLLCISGRSIISTGVEQYDFCKTSELIFLAGSLIEVIKPSPDFKVRMLLFPKNIFLKAALPIDTSYFNYMSEAPYFNMQQTIQV